MFEDLFYFVNFNGFCKQYIRFAIWTLKNIAFKEIPQQIHTSIKYMTCLHFLFCLSPRAFLSLFLIVWMNHKYIGERGLHL
ncbi:hypothetical protein AFK71_19415 [Virgibacillus pantothenticus]|uniref:Uncharacterized protein n=1 Tax=Virgibacillus pantothenticus TaxID=1473 RepID=A0A0L0QPP1_VIRPA|nr:hypothetical protein AFK71_19415 [Virgibacillus pantothenticus]